MELKPVVKKANTGNKRRAAKRAQYYLEHRHVHNKDRRIIRHMKRHPFDWSIVKIAKKRGIIK